MSKSIFQNPKKAAMFVGGTMVAVMILVGSEDREGALVQAAATVESSSAQSQDYGEYQPSSRPVQQRQQVAEQSEAVTWADDGELIDDTSGFDPTPDEFDPDAGDMYIVEDEF